MTNPLELELTRFRGHLSIGGVRPHDGSPHAKNTTALPAGQRAARRARDGLHRGECLRRGKRVASHLRSARRGGHATVAAHMWNRRNMHSTPQKALKGLQMAGCGVPRRQLSVGNGRPGLRGHCFEKTGCAEELTNRFADLGCISAVDQQASRVIPDGLGQGAHRRGDHIVNDGRKLTLL